MITDFIPQDRIRNIAIIAHVDHGKTTLVDQLFDQSGLFKDHETHARCMMDSMDLERERGITISAKNGAFTWKDHLINIIDTPGHADFGGQVERVLRMADGVLLLVDAQEGPMPQTYFVLKKALALSLPVVVVINKIDKPAARPDWVLDQVFDLFVKLGAPDHILDFPVVYGSAKNGYMRMAPDGTETDLTVLYDTIIAKIPPPAGDPESPLQMLVSSIDYSPYLGRLGIGKVTGGKLNINKPIAVALRDGSIVPARVTKIYRFWANEKIPVEEAGIGEVIAIAGMDSVTIGVTFTDPERPAPLPPLEIDPPTISMNFIPNDSPFAGKEGQFQTSRQIQERLARETLSDVALQFTELTDRVGYSVSGRGEMHLSILIEKMRREGFEFQVTRPQVIYKEENGQRLEPYEELTVDVDEGLMGAVIEKLGQRKGIMREMTQNHGLVRLVYRIPTRGLLGYKSEFMTDTRGMGVMSYIFLEYGPFAGELRNRKNGAMTCKEMGTTAAYALDSLQQRGTLFVGPGVEVYMDMIVGEQAREGDMLVNPCKGKKLSNMRTSGTDEAIMLTPPRILTLEDSLAWINDDELVEVTPKNIRLRKMP